VSKESRRAARLARESRRVGTSTGAPDVAGPATRRAPAPPPAGTRAGRRERVRPGPRPSFFERYRSTIITIAAVAVVAVAVGFVFLGSTAASYACDSQFNPSPTPAVAPGSSARLGFVQEDMGRSHAVTSPEHYLFCPPASGSHLNQTGLGPIKPQVYKPDDKVGPPNWVHNLEHGGLVVLYRSDSPGATSAGQQAFRTYFDSFPASPICKVPAGQVSPVIARFDDMPHPFAAIVWDRVQYLDPWDPELANRFYLTESERLDSEGVLNRVNPPEPQCAGPSAIPSIGPSESAGASGSVAPSVAPSTAPAPSASAEASAAPS
jgi:hypothetical protein